MYQSYYGLNAKPFQLRPDPHFFFPSKGHKRAMAYLEYGLSQGEGFITITGEVGAGKTTLVRNLFRKLESEKIVAAQIVNTHVDADDILRMVTAAFCLPFENADKATLLTRLEQFFRQCDAQGKRALLVVDEAQNLSVRAIEELRMLSNFQTADKSLLQTFLLGQPEFRNILHGDNMVQLRQRVTASYHLGAMDALETQAYIEHRLHTAGWHNDPSMNDDAMHAIYNFSGGIPRKINSLCDRLFLMGYLEEIHAFGAAEVNAVIGDIEQEFSAPTSETLSILSSDTEESEPKDSTPASLDHIDERLLKMERSILSVLDALRKILSPALPKNANKEKN